MRRYIHPVFAVAAALALAGCGGGSKTTSTSSSPSSSSSSSASSSAPAATTPSNPPEQFRQVLMNGSNPATPQQATCVVNKVVKRIGRPKFDRLYGKGNTPEDVKTVILQATQQCAPRGFGR